ncbi:MAG: T9SS type A sorting domain-containing protein [Candidatus Marinimicrobia bacterium]|nr:T9SS type A sorting domain-containing protein [Candidatus Neomarinimicrobiota bacterium]
MWTIAGNTELHGPVSATPIESAFPAEFRLYPNYPNPFNPFTTISYDLPDDGFVDLSVYNMRGEKVTTLIQGKQEAGSYRMNWDGTSQSGDMVASGIYFLRIASGSYSRTNKMIFIR